MVPIFIFNNNGFQPLPYLCFCIITYTTFWYNQLGWHISMTTITYFCSYWIWEHDWHMSCKGHRLLQPLVLLFKCDSHCPRIGSLELSMVCCISNLLMFDYIKPGQWVFIKIRMWLCNIVYLSRSSWRNQEKREKKKVGHNINHQDFVFDKGVHDTPQNWQ